MALFEPLFEALERAQVRYVVVGGVAVVIHGHPRLTADVDLVVDLAPAEARLAVETLRALGLVPRAPVDPLGFADAAVRATWIQEKGMRVFSWWDPKNPMREVDVFVEHPVSFEDLWRRSESVALSTTTVRVASITDLVTMKRLAGRPIDLTDVAALEAIARLKGTPHGK